MTRTTVPLIVNFHSPFDVIPGFSGEWALLRAVSLRVYAGRGSSAFRVLYKITERRQWGAELNSRLTMPSNVILPFRDILGIYYQQLSRAEEAKFGHS
jgi:hypothetical protein